MSRTDNSGRLVVVTEQSMVLFSTVAGSIAYVDLTTAKAPISASVYPGTGCTIKVETCNVPNAASSPPADSKWEEWEFGQVTSTQTGNYLGPLAAIRFTRTAGSVSSDFVVRGS